MPDPLPNAHAPLAARRRADQLRAIALEMIVTSDELSTAEKLLRGDRAPSQGEAMMAEALRDALDEVAALGEACGRMEAENQRLRRELSLLVALRPSLRLQDGPVPPPAPADNQTPDPDASVLQARPTRRSTDSDDEWAARCYLHGYRVGHAAGQRFAAWQSDNPPAEGDEQWSVHQVTPHGVLSATLAPFALEARDD